MVALLPPQPRPHRVVHPVWDAGPLRSLAEGCAMSSGSVAAALIPFCTYTGFSGGVAAFLPHSASEVGAGGRSISPTAPHFALSPIGCCWLVGVAPGTSGYTHAPRPFQGIGRDLRGSWGRATLSAYVVGWGDLEQPPLTAPPHPPSCRRSQVARHAQSVGS